MITIKKYSNRRLYDTSRSAYITLDELIEPIRSGQQLQVLDAKSGEDLTQQTLAQVVFECRDAARLFPVSTLTELIAMEDEALRGFLSHYVGWALSLYLNAPHAPMRQGAAVPPPPPLQPRQSSPETPQEVAKMRQELDEIKALLSKVASSKPTP